MRTKALKVATRNLKKAAKANVTLQHELNDAASTLDDAIKAVGDARAKMVCVTKALKSPTPAQREATKATKDAAQGLQKYARELQGVTAKLQAAMARTSGFVVIGVAAGRSTIVVASSDLNGTTSFYKVNVQVVPCDSTTESSVAGGEITHRCARCR